MNSKILDNGFNSQPEFHYPIIDDRLRLVNMIIDTGLIWILYLIYVVYMILNETGNGLLINMFWDWYFPISMWFIIKFIYYFIFELATRKTPGKYLTKTIVEIDTPNKLIQIFLRTLIRLIPFEGLFMFIKRVPLHDYLTKSYLRREAKKINTIDESKKEI